MSGNFKTVYLYTVSLITLIMIIGGIISTVTNITSYFFPNSYVFFEQETVVTSSYNKSKDVYTTEQKNEIKRQNYKNEKIKNAVVSIVVIAVGGIMYKYHWNIIEKEMIK